jgi:hypothetical protein
VSNPDTPHAMPYPEAQAVYLLAWPVPYRLTPAAEQLLADADAAEAEAGEDPGPGPEAGS